MNGQSEYRAGIYCRLSNEDGSDGYSASIETQRQVCEDFCKENHIPIHDIFVDDGYTGINFERPDFKRLIGCIERKEINTIIVKDLSRFGRNQIETEILIKIDFPKRGVRFIAIHDNFDTLKDNMDYNMMFSFQSIFNEFYPMDCSKKTRRALEAKARNGEYIGAFAPYGYRKSAQDKHVLEIDPETAPTVKRIFELLAYNGFGCRKIACILREERVIKPEANRFRSSGIPYDKDPYDWNTVSVKNIAHNEIYKGTYISGKIKKYSFKSNRMVKQPKENWIVIPDLFQPIVSKELWDAAQHAMESRKREATSGFDNIFGGLLKCADCGHSLGLSSKHGEKAYYACSLYKKKGKCSCHYLRYKALYDAVLKDVQSVWATVMSDKKAFTERLLRELESSKEESDEAVDAELRMLEKEISKIDSKIETLFDSKTDGDLTDETFSKLLRKFKHEREAVMQKKEKLEAGKREREEKKSDYESFVRTVEHYSEIPYLDREILNRLIDTIYVSEQRDDRGKPQMSICIHYKFIGKLA